jgi:PEP-CTERM motif
MYSGQFLIILLAAWTTLGQASFRVSNIWRDVDAPTFDAQGTPLEGDIYRAELWGGATTDSLSPALSCFSRQRVTPAFFTGAGAGYFRDDDLRLGPGDDPSILSVPPLGLAWLQMRAWDTRLGATYEEVAALGLGGYGESVLFYARGGDPTTIPPGLQAPLTGLQSFSLRPIPEPSTWGLLVVGGVLSAGFVLRRRRV